MGLTFLIQPDLHTECLLWERVESLSFLQDSLPPDLTQPILGSLPNSEHRQHEKLGVLYALQQQWKLAGQLRQQANGAPFLAEDSRQITISHCKKYLAVGLSNAYPIGIDVENTTRPIEHLAARFLHTEEYALFPGNTFVCMAWSMKEAIYKCIQQDGLDFRNDIRLTSLSPINSQSFNFQLPAGTIAYKTNAKVCFKNKKYYLTLACILYDSHSYAISWLSKTN